MKNENNKLPKVDRLIWTQDQDDLDIFLPVDQHVNKKNIKFILKQKYLEVIVKGDQIICGQLQRKVIEEQSFWTIEDDEVQSYKGKFIHICLEKLDKGGSWWSTPICGGQQIDTSKLPKLKTYQYKPVIDHSVPQTVRLKYQGKLSNKPSQPDLKKLDQFIKAHPQLDFSQCKFD